MKKFFIFFVFFLFSIYFTGQEKQEQNLKMVPVENIYGYWAGVDQTNNIIKIKTEDKILEFKFQKGKIKLLGRDKNIKFSSFKEGDFVKVLYKINEEGVNVATRIIKDPPKPQNTSPSNPGN